MRVRLSLVRRSATPTDALLCDGGCTVLPVVSSASAAARYARRGVGLACGNLRWTRGDECGDAGGLHVGSGGGVSADSEL